MGLDRIIPAQRTPALPGTALPTVDEGELRALAATAGESLQEMQRLLGRRDTETAFVRFPRGYLIEIGRWRLGLEFVRSQNVRNNIAYTLMMHDVQAWLLRRTDVAATARDMLIKSAINALGSIAEAIIVDATSPPLGKRQRVHSRINHLNAGGRLGPGLDEELKWLWDTRNRQHLSDLSGSEFEFYEVTMLPRAEAAVESLIVGLQ